MISPTLLNEVAFNYNGNRINIFRTGVVSRPADFHFAASSRAQQDDRIPDIHLSGTTGIGLHTSWPWNNKADDYQIRDDVSWTKGAHQFKLGGSWAIYKKVQDLFGQTQGASTSTVVSPATTSPISCSGYANAYTEARCADIGHWNNESWALYFQDNWRVNKRLTLNLGLRWDGVPHTYEANNRMGNFYPNLYDPSKPPILDANGNICSRPVPGLGPAPTPSLAAGTSST